MKEFLHNNGLQQKRTKISFETEAVTETLCAPPLEHKVMIINITNMYGSYFLCEPPMTYYQDAGDA